VVVVGLTLKVKAAVGKGVLALYRKEEVPQELLEEPW
jgi:hypothetical protein